MNLKKFIDKEEQRIKKSGINRFDFENLYSFPGENTDFNFTSHLQIHYSLLTKKKLIMSSGSLMEIGVLQQIGEELFFVFQNGKKINN